MVNRGWGFYELHLAKARLRHYLVVCAGNQEQAIRLYLWNAGLSAELWKALDPGQVISELPFGFWHQLVSRRQMFLWPDLAGAFPHMPGRRQSTVSDRIGRLRSLRNRIGHHHRIWALDLAALYGDLLEVAGFIDPELSDWIDAHCDVRSLLARRP